MVSATAKLGSVCRTATRRAGAAWRPGAGQLDDGVRSGRVAVNPSWLTANVVQLAQAIYKERAFDRLPILADALRDAGCKHDELLTHCRSEGPHVRGCWAVDLLLGKG